MNKKNKRLLLLIVLSIALLLSISIPTLARYKNRVTIYSSNWDGTIADCYRGGDGTIDNPYIISNARELAYFSKQLETTDYENTYFSLSKDIMINEGILLYDDINGITYKIDNTTYYVDEFTNKYYSSISKTGEETGTINIFNPLNNFNGIFDGNSHTIYGLYLTSSNADYLGFFTNLGGDISDLYFDNSLIYGGIITSGVVANSNSSSLENIIFNGNVIGEKNNLELESSTNLNIDNYDITNTLNTVNIDLTNNLSFYGANIISTSIKGNYLLNGSADVKINNVSLTDNTFDIPLGNTLNNNIPLTLISNTNASITFSDVKYIVTYEYGVTSGIIGTSNETTITNCINKGNIKGINISSGIAGVSINTTMNSSYNKGTVNGLIASGLIGIVDKSINNIIDSSYNDGQVTTSGLVGTIINSDLNILNSINTVNYSIDAIINSNVNVTNSYYTSNQFTNNGTIIGIPILTTLNDLKNKEYIITNLSMNEFISISDLTINNTNKWVFEDNQLPILYIDDKQSYSASIHVSTYTYTNITDEIKEINFNTSFIFSIENAPLVFLKEIYYYITPNVIPIVSTSELNQDITWLQYNSPITINTEGKYIIYAKVVDNTDNITYLNTDLICLDQTKPNTTINLNDLTWNDFSEKAPLYLDSSYQITVNANDEMSGIRDILYYISNNTLSLNELEAMNDNLWNTYSNLSITDLGTKNIYFKILDKSNNQRIINTPSITLDGYTINNLSIGRNNSYPNTNILISDKSTISLNTSYSTISTTNNTHYLVSNKLLPTDTIITIIDNPNHKKYHYQLPNNNDKVPFTLFTEVGGTNQYIESDYTSENFTIILDFSNTSINEDIEDIKVYLELYNDSNCIRPTLNDSKVSFNLYKNKDASLEVLINSSMTINYDIDSQTNIDITSRINYQNINDQNVIDSTYEDMKMGLLITLIDSENNVMNHKYLANFKFMIGNNEYYVLNDGVHIDLGNTFDTNQILSITTYANNSDLLAGTYYLKLTNYMSYDGIFPNYLGDSKNITVIKSNEVVNIPYSFDVLMNDTSRIISKLNNPRISFDIIQNGELTNPNIRVSLYKKTLLTSLDQTYTLVELNDVLTTTLTSITSGIYEVTNSPIAYDGTPSTYNHFELEFNSEMLEYKGYKVVFELYDSTKRVGKIEKYFIVK